MPKKLPRQTRPAFTKVRPTRRRGRWQEEEKQISGKRKKVREMEYPERERETKWVYWGRENYKARREGESIGEIVAEK